MRDITDKFKTLRTATAQATLKCDPETIIRIRLNDVPKGNPLEVAKVAAIQAAKNTSQIIPYCHPIPVEYVGVEFTVGDAQIDVTVTAKTIYRTGIEMEALTAASVAMLTLYDMLKMMDDTMEIVGVKLIDKRGGKSDFHRRARISQNDQSLRVAVLVMSDSISTGENVAVEREGLTAKDDLSGRLIVDRLKAEGMEIVDYRIIPDEIDEIVRTLIRYADEMSLDLVITTGGTGVGPRDVTPEATREVIERDIHGIAEAIRRHGQERTPFAMLSRGRAGLRGNTLIINFPGSSRGVLESFDALFPGILHTFGMIRGEGH